MELDRAVCDRARRSRDARFDGRFFIGVTSTKIYCRPICPARSPKDENIRYYPTAAAAEAAGLRPCLRCRPEASPGTPAWFGTSSLVSRGLRLISEGALDGAGVDRLADRLGVTARHLRRLFLQHLGATPLQVALTRRAHFAKKLLDETALPFNQVATAAGFGSLRRFNSHIRRTYSRTPTALRRLAPLKGCPTLLARQVGRCDAESYRFRLAYRPPYDWDALLAFLAARATPGVESAGDRSYRRTITVDGKHGSIAVVPSASGPALELDVRFPDPRSLLFIVERVRRMFDLGADPAAIADHLGADPLLREPLRRHPGIRTPGAWDGFELSVRAILGQQISVRGADHDRRTRGRHVWRAGRRWHRPDHALPNGGATGGRAPRERRRRVRPRARHPHARATSIRRHHRLQRRARSLGAHHDCGNRRLDGPVHCDARDGRAGCVPERRSHPVPAGRVCDATLARTTLERVAALARVCRDAAVAVGARSSDVSPEDQECEPTSSFAARSQSRCW